MRDIKRIERILKGLAILWNLNPDQRFYQFLINNGFIGDDNVLWHLEDDKVEEHLNKILKKNKKKFDCC